MKWKKKKERGILEIWRMTMNRTQTRQVQVKNLEIGHNNHVIIQSMCNIETKKADEVAKQILNLEKMGCELIRVSCMDMEDAKAIKDIKKQIHIPLVADIHFDYRLALACIEAGADKIRLNPGNIGSRENVEKVVKACKEKILEDPDFYDTVLSFKSSDPLLCIEAYRLAAKTFDYPLHLGVTEAGTTMTSAIKSSLALGTLLNEGIGNTIRISVNGAPEKEIPIVKELLKDCKLIKNVPNLIACPTCGRTQWDMEPVVNEIESYLQTIHKEVTVAIMGCAVNGPGEAKHADIAIAGGKKEGLLIKKGKIIEKIPQDQIVARLKEEIDKF